MDDNEFGEYREKLAVVLEQLNRYNYGGVGLGSMTTQQTMEMFGLMGEIEETHKKLEETYNNLPDNVVIMEKKK